MKPKQLDWVECMALGDKEFFVALGKRVAQLRKERDLTQQELATLLGVAQQTLAHYEGARLRIPASMLPTLATIFKIPVDGLLNRNEATPGSGKRGPAPKWQQQIEAIAQLPKAQQRFVSQMLDTVLAQATR
ncbi:helix-turn-helix transcriptional regulator [Undibacterium sp. 5I1]|uniref:helix-turn-helix domain-containing protein n=1 Tax=unclassified Undibacterium TaxID=2630295 RepID=UPI002AB502F7|nr:MULTISPECIES: helix-turn-helix transcriptional regulator [unclassified Undibacterium]MDY7540652.1 helix-turn-helix transcriptional regulator [Undibacterium sp. 5I1]MDY7540787.1 helix-turn-helix transcriptional regulator [Undibacterium sp. 5I1]MEB0233146.1 helix-turn-helix transcriptional regulator [Undibacterium sp. 10I3]MEB0259867.1 helix-turn-helix transcriptional regulator [Undibacterium sp. 5I1]